MVDMGYIGNLVLKIKNADLKSEIKIIWKFFYNNAFAYILLYVQNVLINRYMPSDALGYFSYGQSMLVLFASVYSMEVYSAYLRFIGVNNERSILQLTRKILWIASILFSLTVIIFFRDPLYILFFGYMWMRERLYFFRSKLDINTYGRIKILQYLLTILSLIMLILLGYLNERSMLVSIGISYLLVSFIYTFNKRANAHTVLEDSLPPVKAKEIIKYAIPLAFNAIVVWLLGAADQFLIDTYLDTVTLTNYSVAFRIINVIRIGTGVIMEYWPRFYFENMTRKKYNTVKVMYMIFTGIVMIMCVGSIFFSKPLYWLMGAKQYIDVRWMFCMLAAAEMFRQWAAINMTFQSFMKNNAVNVVCLSVLGVFKLVMNIMTIEKWGVQVLFYSTLGCYVIYFICSLWFGVIAEKKYIKSTR